MSQREGNILTVLSMLWKNFTKMLPEVKNEWRCIVISQSKQQRWSKSSQHTEFFTTVVFVRSAITVPKFFPVFFFSSFFFPQKFQEFLTCMRTNLSLKITNVSIVFNGIWIWDSYLEIQTIARSNWNSHSITTAARKLSSASPDYTGMDIYHKDLQHPPL